MVGRDLGMQGYLRPGGMPDGWAGKTLDGTHTVWSVGLGETSLLRAAGSGEAAAGWQAVRTVRAVRIGSGRNKSVEGLDG